MMRLRGKLHLMLTTVVTLLIMSSCGTPVPDADAVVVGAGIAGLSAALEMARGGADVLVVDMSSVFGGHAVSAHGGLAIVASPVQAAAGVQDSPEIAFTDFTDWGEDADEDWVRYYTRHSKVQIHDWAVSLGVEFEDLWHLAGNSVPRFHNVRGRGLGLVTPIYTQGLREGVRFQWNTRIDELIVEKGRVKGVRGTRQRTQEQVELRAPLVMIATGGFQSNLEKVKRNWDPNSPKPDRILAGSGWNSQGLGLDLARKVKAKFHRLDHQWNYVTGLPDPRYPEVDRGLNILANLAIWVNVEGKRFVNECASAKDAVPALLNQPTGSYWAIFDSKGKEDLLVSGSGWSTEKVEALIFGNPQLVKEAPTLPELEKAADIPERALVEAVSRFNTFVEQGADEDLLRFGGDQGSDLDCQKVVRLQEPPFYAMRLYPLARKSMGGIQIDLQGRVLSESGGPVAGLYAAGEVAGFGGINGKAGLEGTFLGPSILTGRVGGRTMLQELHQMGVIGSEARPASPPSSAPVSATAAQGDNSACTGCHDLAHLVDLRRPGYWHFELSHRAIQQEGLQCSSCHLELFPYNQAQHFVDPLARAQNCTNCHGLQAID